MLNNTGNNPDVRTIVILFILMVKLGGYTHSVKTKPGLVKLLAYNIVFHFTFIVLHIYIVKIKDFKQTAIKS